MADVEFDNDIDIDIIILILIIMLKLMLRVVSDSVPPLLIESTRGRLPIRKRARKTFLVHEHLLCHLTDLRTIYTIRCSAEKEKM